MALLCTLITSYLALFGTFVHGQSTELQFPSLNALSIRPQSPPLVYSIPRSNTIITLSIALCSDARPFPRFFMSNTSSPRLIVPGPGDSNSEEIEFDGGVGSWTGQARDGGMIGVWVGQGEQSAQVVLWPFEIAVQEEPDVPHTNHPLPPILGDTTATQATVFSPPFQQALHRQPAYPNYTIPLVPLQSEFPSSIPESSIIILNESAPLSSLPLHRSSCALRRQFEEQSKTLNVTSSSVLRDHVNGWRTEFLLQNLRPLTNYTVYVTQGPKISGPLYLVTKSEQFPCSMVHSLPYCPMVSYPVALPSPTRGFVYNSTNLPESISSLILSSLNNFRRTILTFPCGRDLYSPLRTCTDCFDAYQAWICSVSLPRCGQPATNRQALQQPPLVERLAEDPPRSKGFESLNVGFTHYELLPCIENCYGVARSCPPFIGWSCPSPKLNADKSYGLGIIDSQDGRRERKGLIGAAVDRFGTVWCNGV